jgi:hypothetical protein
MQVPDFLILQWIQSNNGYAYNHRVESVKGGDTMHSGKPFADTFTCLSCMNS